MVSDVGIKEQRNIPLKKKLNQYPYEIKSSKPKQWSAWRSNSVPNVHKNLNHRGKSF